MKVLCRGIAWYILSNIVSFILYHKSSGLPLMEYPIGFIDNICVCNKSAVKPHRVLLYTFVYLNIGEYL